MNNVDAKSSPVYGGHIGLFRKVHKSEWEKVCVNGVVQIYETSEAAEVAAWRALRAHLCSDIVGSGEKVSGARTRGEELFSAIFKRGRKISVERR